MTTLTTPTEISGIPSGAYTLDQSHSRIGFVARWNVSPQSWHVAL